MIIGFMGTKGVGKDTCADFLVENNGYIKKAFADPLKKLSKELFLFTDEQVYGSVEQKETPDNRWFGCTPRLALQYVGTDLLRDQLDVIMPGLGVNVFTNHFRLWYDAQPNKDDLRIVISDVRNQNEVDCIQNLGGVVVKIVRPDATPDLVADVHAAHASETAQATCTYNILLENDSDLPTLYAKVADVLPTNSAAK